MRATNTEWEQEQRAEFERIRCNWLDQYEMLLKATQEEVDASPAAWYYRFGDMCDARPSSPIHQRCHVLWDADRTLESMVLCSMSMEIGGSHDEFWVSVLRGDLDMKSIGCCKRLRVDGVELDEGIISWSKMISHSPACMISIVEYLFCRMYRAHGITVSEIYALASDKVKNNPAFMSRCMLCGLPEIELPESAWQSPVFLKAKISAYYGRIHWYEPDSHGSNEAARNTAQARIKWYEKKIEELRKKIAELGK